MLPILYSQYHACWWPGDFRSQGICRYGIDQIRWNIRSLASEELIWNRCDGPLPYVSKCPVKSIRYIFHVWLLYLLVLLDPKFLLQDVGPVLLKHVKWYGVMTSSSSNGCTAFIWKLHCHWLKGLCCGIAFSHHENHRSADRGWQNTCRTSKPPLYNHLNEILGT